MVSTKKWYSSFLKYVFIFQKICFKVKVLKTFETSPDCHIAWLRIAWINHIFCIVKLFYMARPYLTKKETQAFLTQQLNIFYLLKDSRSPYLVNFHRKFKSFQKFFKCFIIFTSYPYCLSYFLFLFIPFKFTVLYINIYRKKSHMKRCRSFKPRAILKIPSIAFQKNVCSFCWL